MTKQEFMDIYMNKRVFCDSKAKYEHFIRLIHRYNLVNSNYSILHRIEYYKHGSDGCVCSFAGNKTFTAGYRKNKNTINYSITNSRQKKYQ